MEAKSLLTIEETIMRMAQDFANCRSKDPSSKVGACVYNPVTLDIFFGYNGFIPGVEDSEFLWNNRDESKGCTKYDFVVHAEPMAIKKAMISLGDLSGCTLFVTHIPCDRCMRDWIALSGIKRVVFIHDTYPSRTERVDFITKQIAESCNIAMQQLGDI